RPRQRGRALGVRAPAPAPGRSAGRRGPAGARHDHPASGGPEPLAVGRGNARAGRVAPGSRGTACRARTGRHRLARRTSGGEGMSVAVGSTMLEAIRTSGGVVAATVTGPAGPLRAAAVVFAGQDRTRSGPNRLWARLAEN